jgi:hypothetical protein
MSAGGHREADTRAWGVGWNGSTIEFHLSGRWLFDQLGPPGKFFKNTTKLTCLEITGYRIKESTVLWLLELQIRWGQKVYTQVHTVNSNSQTSNCQCSVFSKERKKSPIIQMACHPD